MKMPWMQLGKPHQGLAVPCLSAEQIWCRENGDTEPGSKQNTRQLLSLTSHCEEKGGIEQSSDQ